MACHSNFAIGHQILTVADPDLDSSDVNAASIGSPVTMLKWALSELTHGVKPDRHAVALKYKGKKSFYPYFFAVNINLPIQLNWF